jgi:hypothetical protein
LCNNIHKKFNLPAHLNDVQKPCFGHWYLEFEIYL